MLHTPMNAFKGIITNMTGRPSVTWGTQLTPTQNAYPAYVEILSDTAYDCFGIEIFLHSAAYTGEARDIIVTIGIDHAGGTTYTDCEINHLIATNCGTPLYGGVRYFFPLFIPAGSAIAAKASVSHATARNIYVGVKLYGRPTHPELVRAGSYVDTFGAVTAASDGTTITSGTTNDGSWTEVTAGDTTRPYWFWQVGWGANDLSLTAVMYSMDVAFGTAGAEEVVLTDVLHISSGTAEQMVQCLANILACVGEVPAGQRIYVRFQCHSTADSNLSTIVYAMGG
jgi:hypothetical protein